MLYYICCYEKDFDIPDSQPLYVSHYCLLGTKRVFPYVSVEKNCFKIYRSFATKEIVLEDIKVSFLKKIISKIIR